ncbi:hypothetical protein D5086_001792 [Populus alba]|uniref:Uncharacterized protein n=1 Tax=Populus alba TaxID=43335 RepID=A0ACC4CZN2_POPAL
MDSCPVVKNILLLDSEGKRVAVKYYSDDWPTNNAKLAFEKSLFAKTMKSNARTEAEITMFDSNIVIYKFVQDLHFYVTGGEDENELILAAVLQGFFDSVTLLLRSNVDKREALENLDLIFLCLDEIVERGMILETDANVIAGKVAVNSMDPTAPLSEQLGGGRKGLRSIAGGKVTSPSLRQWLAGFGLMALPLVARFGLNWEVVVWVEMVASDLGKKVREKGCRVLRLWPRVGEVGLCVVERLVQSVMVWELMGVMSVSGKYRKEEDGGCLCVMDEGLGKLQDFPLLVKAMYGRVLWNQKLNLRAVIGILIAGIAGSWDLKIWDWNLQLGDLKSGINCQRFLDLNG